MTENDYQRPQKSIISNPRTNHNLMFARILHFSKVALGMARSARRRLTRWIRRRLNISPKNLLQVKAFSLYRKQNFEQLFKLRSEAERKYRADSYLYILCARALMVLGRHAEAIEEWKKALDKQNQLPEPILGLARCAYYLKDYRSGLGYIDELLQLDSSHAEARFLQSRLLAVIGEPEQTLSILEKLCEEQPADIRYWRYRISLLHRMNRHQDAEDAFLSAETRMATDANFKCQLAFLYEEYLLHNRATLLADEALSITNNPSTTLETLVQGYYDLGRIDIAAKYTLHLKQADEKRFNQSLPVKQITHLLDHSGVTIKDAGSRDNSSPLYAAELVAKAITTRTNLEAVQPRPIRKISFVSTSIRRGGAERQLIFCIQSLLKDQTLQAEVELYSHSHAGKEDRHDTTYYDEIMDLPVRLISYGAGHTWDIMDHPSSKILEPWADLLLHLPKRKRLDVASLFYQFIDNKPDLVHAWQDTTNVNAAMAALMAGVPRILMSARSLSQNEKTMMHKLNAGYLRGAYKHLLHAKSVTLCHNSLAGASSYRQWLGEPTVNFPIIYNGTDFQALNGRITEEEKERLHLIKTLVGDRLVVGSIFRFVAEKRPLLWIDIATEVLNTRKDVLFVMVGDGPMLSQCRDKVDKLGVADKFIFTGNSRAVGKWLEMMDAFLLTSSVEGLPNVLIEAQGMGVPVITANAGGSAETIVDGETGFVVNDASTGAMAEKLLVCLDNTDWRKNAATEAYQHARSKFSVQNMYSELAKIYASLAPTANGNM